MAVLLFASCAKQLNDMEDNPYLSGTKKLNIQLTYPEKYASMVRAGVAVTVSNPATGVEYDLVTDANGACSVDLQYGFYKVSASDKGVSESGTIPLFNKNIDAVKLKDSTVKSVDVTLDMVLSYSSQLVIKELYFSGCLQPNNKSYTADGYVQIYNNSDQIAYLDSLCFGCADSYNSATKPSGWMYKDASGNFFMRDTIPIIEAVWQFPGTGTSFPLNPGESTVLCYRGAIDHTLKVPNSVDLSKSNYFVAYNQAYTLTTWHPTPSPNLKGHWLDLLWKQGTSTAYAFSVLCPSCLLFKIQGVTAKEFVNNPENRSTKPGTSSSTEYIMVPSSWIIDGMEVMRTASEYKRLPSTVDAGYCLFPKSDTYKGYTVHRYIDKEATATAGRTVFMDTNNSLTDFYLREGQSIAGRGEDK